MNDWCDRQALHCCCCDRKASSSTVPEVEQLINGKEQLDEVLRRPCDLWILHVDNLKNSSAWRLNLWWCSFSGFTVNFLTNCSCSPVSPFSCRKSIRFLGEEWKEGSTSNVEIEEKIMKSWDVSYVEENLDSWINSPKSEKDMAKILDDLKDHSNLKMYQKHSRTQFKDSILFKRKQDTKLQEKCICTTWPVSFSDRPDSHPLPTSSASEWSIKAEVKELMCSRLWHEIPKDPKGKKWSRLDIINYYHTYTYWYN